MHYREFWFPSFCMFSPSHFLNERFIPYCSRKNKWGLLHIEINYIFSVYVWMVETIGIMYIMIIFNAQQRQSCRQKQTPIIISFRRNHSTLTISQRWLSSASYDCVPSIIFAFWDVEVHGLCKNKIRDRFLFPFCPSLFYGQKRADRWSAVKKVYEFDSKPVVREANNLI